MGNWHRAPSAVGTMSLSPANLGPPARPKHAMIDVVTITPGDVVQLAADAGLALEAPAAEWQSVADRLSFAFAGYAAGTQREGDQPANTRLQAWGAALAEDAQRLMARVGFDEAGADAWLGTWNTTELSAEALAPRVAAGGPEVSALLELQQHLGGLAEPIPAESASPDADEIDLLLQRALFHLMPTLRLLGMAGSAVEQSYGDRIRRGGSSTHRSVRWLFKEIVTCFEILFAVKPKILPPGGRDRGPRDSVHLPWFLHLFSLVEQRATISASPEAAVLRELAEKARDRALSSKNYDRLRNWIVQAGGKE